MSDIRSTPIPGYRYTVRPGDTPVSISARAYGDRQRWPDIWRANETRLRSGNPNLIYPGEVLYIPELPERRQVADRLPGSAPDSIRVVSEGIELPVTSARLIRTMDTAADAMTAMIPWTPGADRQLDELLLPYRYPDIDVYLGGELIMSGRIYTVKRQVTQDGRVVEIEAFSTTVDLVQCTVRPPYEYRRIDLVQFAEVYCAPKGLRVEVDPVIGDDVDMQANGPTWTADPMETEFEFLDRIAGQYGLLISSTVTGDFLWTRANTSGRPVDTLDENETPLPEEYTATFDGTKRYSAYRAIHDDQEGGRVTVDTDPTVPGIRFLTFRADEQRPGNVASAARWRKNKTIADALTVPFPVSGWRDRQDRLWRENSIVTVISPTLSLPDGFDFLIKRVEYVYASDGVSAILQLVPPQVYTGEDVPEPWRVA